MILYSLQDLQTLSWGPWTCTVRFFVGCHCLTGVPLILYKFLGWESFQTYAGVLESVQQVASHQTCAKFWFYTGSTWGVQNEGRVSMFKPGGLDSVHSFSRYSDFSWPFFSCLFGFWIFDFFFFGGSFFHMVHRHPQPKKLTIKCKPHRWEATHFKMVCLNLEISGRMS